MGMSGHSKWSTIKHKKAANDSIKGSVFTKMAKGITMAVKKGGGVSDPDINFSLRLAMAQARSVNMPKDNIERAIAKASGVEGGALEELIIEGFGPSGVAVIINLVTDNRNRSIAELRTLMEKHGGQMGSMGSALYMFDFLDGIYKPKYPISVAKSQEVLAFIDALLNHDDVEGVYDNLG